MSKKKTRKPDWVPPGGGMGFATSLIPGESITRKPKGGSPRRKVLSIQEYIDGVRSGERMILARAITLVESNNVHHQEIAQEVLTALLPETGKSFRLGISGMPGAGKSTLIETIGLELLKEGKKVAVLAVDPSSSITKGSILGDKTRMQNLSRAENSFIRPSPSGGTLGGVARKSRETMLLCEAAGFDTIIVETIGVGQNEITVRSMVDIFIVLMIAGAGDELQAIKKGVLELADLIVVTKADGDNDKRAEMARAEYARALHYLADPTPGWETRSITCSSWTGRGIDELLRIVDQYEISVRTSGVFSKRRNEQFQQWMHSLLEEQLRADFYRHPAVRVALPGIVQRLNSRSITPLTAAKELLKKGGH